MFILFSCFLVFVHTAYSNYYYYAADLGETQGITSQNVYSVNLLSGEKRMVLTCVNIPIVLSDMSKIVFKSISDAKICVYDTQNETVDTLAYLGKCDRLINASLIAKQYIYIWCVKQGAGWYNKEKKIRNQTKILIDKDFYSIVDSTAHHTVNRNNVFSKDGKVNYFLTWNTDGLSFRCQDTNSGEVTNNTITIEKINNKKIETEPWVKDKRNGFIFFEFLTKSENLAHEIVYVPENHELVNYIITSPISMPPVGTDLTESGDMVFQDFKQGQIYILEKGTTKLKQRLKVTPAYEDACGKQQSRTVILFDHLYYFPEDPKKSDASIFDNIGHADLTKIQSDASLAQMLIDDVDDCHQKGWITDQTAADKYKTYFTNIQNYIQQENMAASRTSLKTVLQSLEQDSGSVMTSEAYYLLSYNAERLLERLPEIQESGFSVQLLNSQNQPLTGGTLKYYEGGWKEAVNNGDGTFRVEAEQETVKLRMTYAHASVDMTDVPVNGGPVTFQTVPVQVELRDSQNQRMDEGFMKYYSGGWRTFGTTSGGIAVKELLPNSYKFRMTHAFASNDLTQDVGDNETVVFQTVPVQVELRDSQNQFMDEGTVKYYSGGWRTFGTTSGGIAVKELLPKSYKFRLTYAHASNDLTQDVDDNETVVFQTVPVQVELRDSQNQLMDEGTVKYYSGGWRTFGNTSGGVVEKELLPNAYKFRMTFAYASNDMTQNIEDNPLVSFQTIQATVELRDSQNQLMDEGTVKYYSGGWRDFDATSGGIAEKELLPNSYKFRMTYAYASEDRTQDLSENETVTFSTVRTTVTVKDAQGNHIDGAVVKYYSGGWRNYGTTSGGIAEKELLAKSYKFRATYSGSSRDVIQDVSVNPDVEIVLD